MIEYKSDGKRKLEIDGKFDENQCHYMDYLQQHNQNKKSNKINGQFFKQKTTQAFWYLSQSRYILIHTYTVVVIERPFIEMFGIQL